MIYCVGLRETVQKHQKTIFILFFKHENIWFAGFSFRSSSGIDSTSFELVVECSELISHSEGGGCTDANCTFAHSVALKPSRFFQQDSPIAA